MFPRTQNFNIFYKKNHFRKNRKATLFRILFYFAVVYVVKNQYEQTLNDLKKDFR